uniref:Olfactory receptor n=1 Tax=Sphenodon punctatus TaxID=8508 RepID=A0A8D0GMH6_SPHPU
KPLDQTNVTEFLLLGFTDIRWLQILLFLGLLLTYLLTITGNILIVVITLVNHHLYTPMYFFLRHFSILEIGFTTTIIPKALANMATGGRTISVAGCFTQFFLYFILGTTEFLLLAAMSFDRYVAICNPLCYTTIMNSQFCSLLVMLSWAGGLLLILGPAITLFQMPFCDRNVINHFFCDSAPLIKLSCTDTRLLELMSCIIAVLSLLGTLAITIMSYTNIISTVMSITSASGRKKAFSTCVSHITVVSITYGSCIFMYIKPRQEERLDFSKVVAILNTVVSPLLNPFIYTLRNKQIQEAMREAIRRIARFSKWNLLN